MKTDKKRIVPLVAAILAGSAVVFVGCVTVAIAQTVSPGGPAAPVDGTTAGVLGTAVAAVVYAGLKLRTRLSRDNVDIKADSYVQQALEQSQKDAALAREERNRAMEEARTAWATRNGDAKLIGELTTENRMLREQLTDVQQQIAAIRRGVQSVGQNVDSLKTRVEETQQRVTGNAPLGNT